MGAFSERNWSFFLALNVLITLWVALSKVNSVETARRAKQIYNTDSSVQWVPMEEHHAPVW